MGLWISPTRCGFDKICRGYCGFYFGVTFFGTQCMFINWLTQACEKTCYQRNVIEQCRCSDAYFPPSNLSAFNHVIVPVCSASNLTQGTPRFCCCLLGWLTWVVHRPQSVSRPTWKKIKTRQEKFYYTLTKKLDLLLFHHVFSTLFWQRLSTEVFPKLHRTCCLVWIWNRC